MGHVVSDRMTDLLEGEQIANHGQFEGTVVVLQEFGQFLNRRPRFQAVISSLLLMTLTSSQDSFISEGPARDSTISTNFTS